MQNWQDNTQLEVPGYRDRVAYLFLFDNEGGLNPKMEQEAILQLSKRGEMAGKKLRLWFSGQDRDSKLDWDHHRWVRYRTSMTLVETYLENLCSRYASPPQRGERSYPELVQRKLHEPPQGYQFTARQRQFAVGMTKRLATFMQARSSAKVSFEKGTPRPIPELRIRPRF
jgi:hypothetical protein